MKIAVVVPGGLDRSGEVKVVPALLALLERLAARHEVHVFALRQEPRPAQWWLCGARVHNIGGRQGAVGVLRAVGAIGREHRRGAFDLVQAIWSGSVGLAAVLAARWLGLPCAVHVAGGELVALADIGYGGRLTWRGRLREAWVLRHADRRTAASAPVLAQLASLGYAAERLPLGVDLRHWQPRPPRARQPGEPLRLVQMASLNRVKDLGCLLRALACVPGVLLDVIGEDTLQGEMQALVARLGLADRVCFHGFLTQPALRPVVARAHVCVVTSRHEAGPLAALEAAVLGLAVVGTAVGHLVEWAPEAARIVQPGDGVGLAALIGQLAGDEPLRLRLAAAAQRRAVAQDAEFTHEQFARLHAELAGR
ncbi:MAG: glycosyltransferase [Burkholderiales bacterium]|nr:MAG: glycosyltransferase [Burkholderiales bacterium]